MKINTKDLPIHVAVPNIDTFPAEAFTQLRRVGFGGSDASVLIGSNPYSNMTDVIMSKVRTEVTPEELEIGRNRNVVAGTDLEPVIIEKFNSYFPQYKIDKPDDMYRFNDFPYLTMNFDGVGVNPKVSGAYIPIEIKFISYTNKSVKNPENASSYKFDRAWWTEDIGFNDYWQDIKPNGGVLLNAATVGLPSYYYPQLQQEMNALNAPYGLLCALYEPTWKMSIWKTSYDPRCFSEIAKAGLKAWGKVKIERARLGLTDADYGLESL